MKIMPLIAPSAETMMRTLIACRPPLGQASDTRSAAAESDLRRDDAETESPARG